MDDTNLKKKPFFHNQFNENEVDNKFVQKSK